MYIFNFNILILNSSLFFCLFSHLNYLIDCCVWNNFVMIWIVFWSLIILSAYSLISCSHKLCKKWYLSENMWWKQILMIMIHFSDILLSNNTCWALFFASVCFKHFLSCDWRLAIRFDDFWLLSQDVIDKNIKTNWCLRTHHSHNMIE